MSVKEAAQQLIQIIEKNPNTGNSYFNFSRTSIGTLAISR